MKLDDVLFAIDRFRRNGNTRTSKQIGAGTLYDEGNELFDDFKKSAVKETPDNEIGETVLCYSVFTRWNQYKAIYQFEQDFLDILSQTDDFNFHAQSIDSLPFSSFIISSDDVILVVHIEPLDCDVLFSVVQISDVDGENMLTSVQTLRIHDGELLSDALQTWLSNVSRVNYTSQRYREIYRTLRTVIQISYYLSAANCVVKKVNVKKERRPHGASGQPMNIKLWNAGHHISAAYRLSDAPGADDDNSRGNVSDGPEVSEGRETSRPRPHIRRAHWHHYWAGKGKTELVVRWIAPVFVNGEEINPVQHKVE